MHNLVRALYCYENTDVGLAKRLAAFIERDDVTHVKMSFGSIGPLALEAKKHTKAKFEYLMTFQGDEEFAGLARGCGVFPTYCRRVDEAVRSSRWPAIVLSRNYAARLVADLGLDPASLTVIYCGVDLPEGKSAPPFKELKATFPRLRADIPIVTFLGRQESEKGVDLLLYALKILKTKGARFQLVICGAIAKDRSYQNVIRHIVGHLELEADVHHVGTVSLATREALFAHSRCIVCPSINGEPFGLVAAEAMSRGTPVVVPDFGGIAEIVNDGTMSGGLHFRVWDSGDLARQLERVLFDDRHHAELAGNAARVAARYSTERMTDAFLRHIGLQPRQSSTSLTQEPFDGA